MSDEMEVDAGTEEPGDNNENVLTVSVDNSSVRESISPSKKKRKM